ncbi:MAG: discoidin domain-containing protein [Muribaculaceae bacterium]|nr:discoidin domain-containing protein [Muribaculaceae bacterium]
MKKNLTLAVAAIAVMTAFGQTNLALNQPSIATSGNAAQGNDGNNGSRWESTHGVDPQLWQVDLGETPVEYNTIVITWEGAYGKTFDIVASNTVGEDGYITDGTVLASVEEQTLSEFPYVQTLTLPQTANYRYVQFHGKQRGTIYGYSFYEFAVYNIDSAPELASMTLSASADQIAVGKTVNLTVAGFDQLGAAFAVDQVEYVLSNNEVGTVANNVFTATAVGETTIKAKVGDVESNEVTIKVIAGQKIDLFTGWQHRIYTLGLATETSKVGAFDENGGSLWDMYKETGADEDSRTYDAGFIADLRGIYDLSNIAIHFEGACSEAFTLAFAGEDGVFGAPAFTGGAQGVNNHTETFDCSDITGVRYVMFLSTKAATQWSVKIYDFAVYGTLVTEVTDNEVPTITSAEAAADAATETSVTLNINGNDNSSKYLAYEINGANYALGTNVAGEASPVVISGLNGGTQYDFNVVAIDAFGNRSEAMQVTAQTTGDVFELTAAPTPTQDAANVVSIYSDAYEPATGYWIGGWGQTTQTAFETVNEDQMYVFTNFNYLGFEYSQDVDLSQMEFLHIDVLPMQDMRLGVTPIMRNTTGATEQPTSVGELTPRQWNSIDLPLSTFTNMDFTSGTNFQFKFDANGGATAEKLYIDNLYFWKSASTHLNGDINGDNIVDVADVNLLIEIMLGRDSASNYTGADIDNNGTVDVADVNAVINIMLGK